MLCTRYSEFTLTCVTLISLALYQNNIKVRQRLSDAYRVNSHWTDMAAQITALFYIEPGSNAPLLKIRGLFRSGHFSEFPLDSPHITRWAPTYNFQGKRKSWKPRNTGRRESKRRMERTGPGDTRPKPCPMERTRWRPMLRQGLNRLEVANYSEIKVIKL